MVDLLGILLFVNRDIYNVNITIRKSQDTMKYATSIKLIRVLFMSTIVCIFLFWILPISLYAEQMAVLDPSIVGYLEVPHRYAVVATGYPGNCNEAVKFLISHGIDASAQGSLTYEVDVSYANRRKAIKLLRSSAFGHLKGFQILHRPNIRVNRHFGKVLAP